MKLPPLRLSMTRCLSDSISSGEKGHKSTLPSANCDKRSDEPCSLAKSMYGDDTAFQHEDDGY